MHSSRRPHAFLIVVLSILGWAGPSHSQSVTYELPDYYVEGSFQVAAARMITNICPDLGLKPGLAEMMEFSLSSQLKEDKILPEGLSEDDRIFRLKLTTDKRFASAMIDLFERYGVDPNGRGSVKKPEVYEKFCAMGNGEIAAASNIGKLIEPGP